MIEPQSPKGSHSKPSVAMDTWGMSISRLVILVVTMGTVGIIIALIFRILDPRPIVFSQSSELNRNQAKWESQHIINYRFSFSLPYSSGTLTVEVKNGKVVSVVDDQGKIISPADQESSNDPYPFVFTVPGLFSYVDQEIRDKPEKIIVSYDPNLGYPTNIYIDPWSEPCCEDFTVEVQNFQLLPP
jgi:hypothetical protein